MLLCPRSFNITNYANTNCLCYWINNGSTSSSYIMSNSYYINDNTWRHLTVSIIKTVSKILILSVNLFTFAKFASIYFTIPILNKNIV